MRLIEFIFSLHMTRILLILGMGCILIWQANSRQKQGHQSVQAEVDGYQCKKLGKYSKVQRTSNFWALRSFEMFAGPLFQIKLHLLSTALLSGFQSSTGALKSTELGGRW